ncbi:MAG: hypothetical protein JWM57_1623 [Phycisphaerales bacterium]|nr:hypothetical protein [Phycisphaerales bacterium]
MKLAGWMAMVLISSAVGFARADAPARQRPAALTSVTIQDAFWSPKRDLWRQTTITDCLNKFEKDGALTNFDLVRDGKEAGIHHGAPWFDGLVYEMITGASGFLVTNPDPQLEARLDGYIDRIAAAAARDPDGYLNTYTTAKEPTHRWGANGGNDLFQHDLYNAGCMVEAGVHYYRATGKTKLLATGVRMANYMCDVMGPAPKKNLIPGHAISELSFFELYQLLAAEPALKAKLGGDLDETRFLKLAQFWIDARGHHEGRKDFNAYDQDHVPVAEQQTIEGHAVRATLLASAITAIGRDGGRPDYLPIADRWWTDMATKRTYLTGGVGASAEAENFGPDYFLPNDGYAETCAAVARAFFDQQMLQCTGNAAAADELERALYNGALSGVSAAGTSYFYENPLKADPKRNRWDWHGCPCCPPMFLKLMSAMPGYIYSTDDHGLFVNLFVGSTVKAKIGQTDVTLTQTSGYPWSGDVMMKVDVKQPATMRLRVRIPEWCRPAVADALYRSDREPALDAFTLAVNGQAANYTVERGYAVVDRTWQGGDVVSVKIDVSPRRILAHPMVAEDRGKMALAAGPLVYCLESTDQGNPVGQSPAAQSFDQTTLSTDGPLGTEMRADLLGGVRVITGQAARKDGDNAAKSFNFTAIPFFATANRGPRSMAVWVPVATENRPG